MKIASRWTVLLAGAVLQLIITLAWFLVAPVTGVTGELRDIKGPLPPDRLFPVLIPAGIAIILAGVIMVFVIMRRGSRRGDSLPETVQLSPDAALDLLERRFREQPEDTGRLYQELSHLVRICLAERTGLPVSRMTTEEFLAQAAVTGASPPDQADRFRVLLLRCDRVKFAGYRPPLPETEATLTTARSLLCGDGASHQ
jgi:hypothetical protein